MVLKIFKQPSASEGLAVPSNAVASTGERLSLAIQTTRSAAKTMVFTGTRQNSHNAAALAAHGNYSANGGDFECARFPWRRLTTKKRRLLSASDSGRLTFPCAPNICAAFRSGPAIRSDCPKGLVDDKGQRQSAMLRSGRSLPDHRSRAGSDDGDGKANSSTCFQTKMGSCARAGERRVAWIGLALWALLSLDTAPAAAEPPQPAPANFCISCVSIRVGPARAIRGPVGTEADSQFTAIKLKNGRIRGFTANRTTFAVDGDDPRSMAGTARPVLAPGDAATFNACGQWLNHAERVGEITYGFVHSETACNYPAGQTWKSMSVAVSRDEGLSWTTLGKIIAGRDGPVSHKISGEGDCSVVKDPDGYFYAYCLRARDWATFVARAPVSDPSPGNWRKYFNGSWSEPGIGGDATALALRGAGGRINGGGASRWETAAMTVLLAQDHGALRMLMSADHINFQTIAEPLLPLDEQSWKRPAPSVFINYATLVDAKTGSNLLSDHAYLVYTYMRPNEGFDKRYLVFQNIRLALHHSPVSPQIGLALARWSDKRTGRLVSTTGPLIGNKNNLALETTTGYLLTRADPQSTSIELDECVAHHPDGNDHVFAEAGRCTGDMHRFRLAGWIYQAARPAATPLFQCTSTNRRHFLSNRDDCEGHGGNAALLGYVLAE